MSLYIVMGVSGCGKSTVAEQLAEKTGGLFLDGDDFHPKANKDKMSVGIPLTDADRWGWLETLNQKLRELELTGKPVFLACSALRASYREQLANGLHNLQFIYLKGSKALIRERMAARKNHFMSPTLLDSQFLTLEEPTRAIVAQISDPIPLIIEKILPQLT